jgi:hypothetical protein
MSLAALLHASFRRTQHAHWSRPGVRLLSEALYEEDLWGLRAFWVPRDEYDFLAEQCIALALCLGGESDLWPLEGPPQGWQGASLEELRRLLEEQANSLNPFGDQRIQVPGELAHCLQEALVLCASAPAEEETGGKGPIEKPPEDKFSGPLLKNGAALPL